MAVPCGNRSPVCRSSSIRRALTGLIVLALAARAGAAWVWRNNLDDDRDVYRALAAGLVEGRGYSSPGTRVPTAYRPPLYPLLLAAAGGANSLVAVAVLNVLLGTATVVATFAAARMLYSMPDKEPLAQRPSAAPPLLAAALVAVDPLLLRYTAFPMTETPCTLLLTAGLAALLRTQTSGGAAQARWAAAAGVLIGLTALCRPTVWAPAVLIAASWLWRDWRPLRRSAAGSGAPPLPGSAGASRLAGSAAIVLLTAAVVVLPWVVRNWRVFGRPIVTTTHGGYTLLLGNNPDYYREVVSQPLGTVWDGSRGAGQAAWAAELNRRLEAAGLYGETERDRWMSREAWRHIREQPLLFVRACVRRLLHFWSIVPGGSAAADAPGLVRYAVGAYYCALFAMGAAGLFWCGVRGGVHGRAMWSVPILVIAGFVAVHLVYWSDARMRAPVMPAVAMLASCGACSVVRRR